MKKRKQRDCGHCHCGPCSAGLPDWDFTEESPSPKFQLPDLTTVPPHGIGLLVAGFMAAIYLISRLFV